MLYDFQIYEEPAENNIEKLNKLEKDIKNGKADERHKILMLAQCELLRKELIDIAKED